ncbi:DUF971 domain-containing protein [Methyloversatilis thermotolerans]|uniref:DUF971 domain-containing protein n=1 Tax=Methyloversatilis thermotolerans TaxID=1346290 RepID=UPI001E50CC35|nr:DUF971 domain-containing protein [Methyloversatilis thermotolerans]
MLHAESRLLEIEWSDGLNRALPHGLLRARCRCAQCERGRRDGQPPAEIASVGVQAVKPLADHGLNFVFSDGHERGIYPWPYLRELCQSEQAARMAGTGV